MNHPFLFLTATCLGLTLASCTSSGHHHATASSPKTARHSYEVRPAARPGYGTGPQYTINGVALHHYEPSLYTPFAYDHRGGAHESYYRAQAVRANQRGRVIVGPMSEDRTN